jgi:DNA-binding CsgD family transcriptional regulator
MLIAIRDGEPTSLDAAGIDELVLPPLTDAHAREVVEARAPGLTAGVRDRVIREAVGNPLALVELSSSIQGDPGSSDVVPEVLPISDRIERAFAARAQDLPEETWWFLLVAALDDRDGLQEMLAAAGVPRSALRPAVEAGLIDIDGSTLRFRHPLVRSAIQQRAGREDRSRAHAALAGVVGDFDRVAWHRAAATDLPDEAVASLLDAAAERAIHRGAFVVAFEALQRAATLSADGRSRGTRLLRAAEVGNDLGRMDSIAQMLAASKPIDIPELEDRRQAWIAALALVGPRSPREAANIRSVVAAATRVGEAGQRDLGLALLQFASARSWWLDPGVKIRSQIAAAARRLGTETDDARVIFIRTIAPEEDVDELLLKLAEHASSPVPESGTDARRYGTAALWMGALDLAVDLFTDSIAGLRREGRLGLLARSLITRAFCAVHLGTLTAVASDLDEGFRLVGETRQPFYLATANVTMAIYLAYRGDIAGAESRIGEVERVVLDAQADGVLAETRQARGIIDLAAGRYDEAYEQLRHLFDPDHPSFHATVGGWAMSDLADAAAATGHRAEATRVLERVEADAVRMKMPWWRIGTGYARAVLAAHGDDPAAAEAAFAQAQVVDLERWPLARARLSLAYGIWLRRERRVAESRAALRSARDVLDAIGVRYLAERARQELGASGEVSRHRGIEVLDELTPQELQIARLAADGLSNREIGSRLYLSHRTVASHLYRAFPKLGITSRAQLHAALS